MRRRQQQQQQQQQDQEEAPSKEELREKLNEYTHFIEHTLYPQLTIALSQREEVESEIKEYQELTNNLTFFKNGKMKDVTMVDLGHQLLYCQAKITDCDHVFVSVGMGFHVEFTIDEAIAFIKRRISFLNREKLPPRVDKAREVAGHVETTLEILESIGVEIQNLDGVSGR